MAYRNKYKIAGLLFVISSDEDAITAIDLVNSDLNDDQGFSETDVIKQAAKELEEYFVGERKHFDVKLNPKGTEFQKKVWNALIDVEYGKTASYKDIAEIVGSPKGFRAVGSANNKNPIPIMIPCHRIIGTNGKLVGYAYGTDFKKNLLDMEMENTR